ncbi:hypothetical protein [Bradyrhizobium sp.]|uniref:hypothetical protein n=1 Tax=Bradyrhizobium sp. TaxID=376 RepID=UPI0027312B0C|nr:hypothetical protein [Bradyrhizobium sp.]MDP1865603.1 hypothetical protein [Bradyrhizobium sp.]MDP3075198.1 hypothetical protein [Bradyrhizobium sp.]
MAYRIYGALIAPLSVAVLILAANDSFARSAQATPRSGAASAHAMPRPPGIGHHRRGHPGAFWPATGGYHYGPTYGEQPAAAEVNQSIRGDIRYTYTQDVPWDWPHRFPPMVAPSDRPYVQSCNAETVTVPGRNNTERTVNIMRCY